MTRLGIVGMGYAGAQLLQASGSIHDLAVTAATDVSRERLQDLPEGVRAAADWRAMVEDPALDAVAICLPHAQHAEVTLAALHSHKHILLEKPLVADLSGSERIAAAAAESDCVVMVEMTHRFYPPMRAARALVEEGRLGAVYAVEDRIVHCMHQHRLPEWMLQRQSSGGGVAMTNGVHMLDRIAWVCGQELTYRRGVASWAEGQGDAEDTAAMVLSLEDGTPVSLLASWPRAKGPVDHELTIYGTTGTLRVWAWQGWRFEPGEGDAEDHVCFSEDVDHFAKVRIGMAGVLREFSTAIREGRTASPSPAEVLKSQAIVEAFYEDIDATL